MTTQVNGKVTVRRYGMTGLTIHLIGFINRFISTGLVLGELSPRGATKMADPAPYPDSNSDTGGDTRARQDREYPGTPRWVKVFGIIVIVSVLLVVIIIFIGGHTSPVQHGP